MSEFPIRPKLRGTYRRLPSDKRAASLFLLWHGVRDLLGEAEFLGDGELVHFLAVIQLMVEEKVAALGCASAVRDADDTKLPN